VVDCSATLSILLVVHPECDGSGAGELVYWCRVGNHGTIFPPKGDILDSELDSSSADVLFRHSVLPNSKKKEKGSCNKVGGRPGERGVWGLMIGPGPFNRGNRDSQLGTRSGVLAFVAFE
jgi:hypothetical protein